MSIRKGGGGVQMQRSHSTGEWTKSHSKSIPNRRRRSRHEAKRRNRLMRFVNPLQSGCQETLLAPKFQLHFITRPITGTICVSGEWERDITLAAVFPSGGEKFVTHSYNDGTTPHVPGFVRSFGRPPFVHCWHGSVRYSVTQAPVTVMISMCAYKYGSLSPSLSLSSVYRA